MIATRSNLYGEMKWQSVTYQTDLVQVRQKLLPVQANQSLVTDLGWCFALLNTWHKKVHFTHLELRKQEQNI